MRLTNFLFLVITLSVFLSCDKDCENHCRSLIGNWCRVLIPGNNSCDIVIRFHADGTYEYDGVSIVGNLWETKGCDELSIWSSQGQPFSATSNNYEIIRVTSDTLEIRFGAYIDTEIYKKKF